LYTQEILNFEVLYIFVISFIKFLLIAAQINVHVFFPEYTGFFGYIFNVAFFFSALFLMFLGAEFLSFVFLLVVYVGALAVLFLFIVMLLDLRLFLFILLLIKIIFLHLKENILSCFLFNFFSSFHFYCNKF
jgi:NADH:ubiquinone oxidoreductase subunit 6 (subunit J)